MWFHNYCQKSHGCCRDGLLPLVSARHHALSCAPSLGRPKEAMLCLRVSFSFLRFSCVLQDFYDVIASWVKSDTNHACGTDHGELNV